MKAVFAMMTVAFVLCMGGCKKEPSTNAPPVRLPADLRGISYFAPGSWWMYEDSATGRVDSSWVIASSDYFAENGYDQTERVSVVYASTLGMQWQGYAECINSSRSRYKWARVGYNEDVLEWPLVVGTPIGGEPDGSDTITLRRIIDSVSLPIGVVGPVYEMVYLPSRNMSWMHQVVWFCPGYGVVRQQFSVHPDFPVDSTSFVPRVMVGDWKLKRANILQ